MNVIYGRIPSEDNTQDEYGVASLPATLSGTPSASSTTLGSRKCDSSQSIQEPPDIPILHVVGLAIHVGFVLIIYIIVVIMIVKAEKNVTVPIGFPTVFWSTMIQIFLQTFAVLYLAAELYISQKLFMQRVLASHQTLTRSHDQYTSWLGLGGALASLYKQRTTRSGALTLILIAFYLLASTIVKIATSALFQLSAVPVDGVNKTFATSMGMLRDHYHINDTGEVATSALHSVMMQQMVMESRYWRMRPALFESNLGLYGNRLYDVIPAVANATKQVNVTAYRVIASCEADTDYSLTSSLEFTAAPFSIPINNSVFSSSNSSNSSLLHKTIFLPVLTFINVIDGDEDGNNQAAGQLPIRGFAFSRASEGASQVKKGDLLVKVKEQAQSSDSVFTCENGVSVTAQPTLGGLGTWTSELSSAQVLACSIRVSPYNTSVDAEKRTFATTPSDISFPDPSVARRPWSNNTLTDGTGVYTLTSSPAFDFGHLRPGPPGDTHATMSWSFACNEANLIENSKGGTTVFHHSPSIFETFMYQSLHMFQDHNGYNISLSDPKTAGFPMVTRSAFEGALENYVAMYLYTRQKADEIIDGVDPDRLLPVDINFSGPVVSQLSLRPFPVYSALVAAFVMLGIAFWFIRTTPAEPSSLDALGMLQLLWISGVDVPVAEPTEDNLRKAGLKTTVRLLDGLGSLKRREFGYPDEDV
ncbi:hypothetical protein DL96DRAFT_725810 [Flagelloscypha sp. PMI_526]|nr:hypothetical protein DL96DRAFT_725810 [Flagelloscypha sp. PMI_526]